MGLGAAGKIAEFNAFRDGLSPSARAAFGELSLLEQTRLANLATRMDLPPAAVEFYLEQTARPGSPLAALPLADALRVSALAEQSGESVFLRDYVTRFGSDESSMAILRIASPEGLQFYVEQAKIPGLALSRLTPQQGVILAELSPASKAKVTGLTTPTIPKGVVPDVNTPVLGLTPQEINVLTKLSTQNPRAEYAVLGLWKNGQGYTVVGSEGYTYLDMPEPVYEFFKKYPGDFRLINEQYLVDLARQDKPIILETPYSVIEEAKTTSAYWEIFKFLEPEYGYSLQAEPGPSGYDLLVPPKK
jgi:hypothetical protein